VTAHRTLDTATIFAHLMSRARPIFGADQSSSGGRKKALEEEEDNGRADAQAPKRVSAASKRKTALARVISKNNRKRRNGA